MSYREQGGSGATSVKRRASDIDEQILHKQPKNETELFESTENENARSTRSVSAGLEELHSDQHASTSPGEAVKVESATLAAEPNNPTQRLMELVENSADFTGADAIPDPQLILPPSDIEHAVIVPKRAPQLQFYGKKTGIAYDVRMRYHSRPISDPASYVDPHPEDPRRTFRIYRAIAEAGLIEDETLHGSEHLGELMQKLPTRQATEEELKMVHTQQMIDFIKSTAGMQLEELQHEIDQGDSIYLNNDSNEAARLSAGGAIEACKGVVEGTVKNAIAVIRPPGHHAEPGNPAGFCLFANVAIASQVMLQNYPDKVKKIMIYDWDVHHGNGTQRAFLDDDRVLYVSTHRYDNGTFYPGTRFGDATVVGDGKGRGYSVNIPWPSGGMGDGDYITAFQKIIMPIASEFDPDLVIVSAGFDAADGDPIGGCHVSPQGYQNMLSMLMTLACGKVVVCLEGGYNLDSISRSALAITKTLLGDPPGRPTSSLASDPALEVFAEIQAVQSQFWRSMGPPVIKFEPEIEAYKQQQHDLSEQAEHAREASESASNHYDRNHEANESTNGHIKNESKEQSPLDGSNASGGSGSIGGVNTSTSASSSSSSEIPADNEDIPVLESLMDVVRSNEAHELTKKYGFAKLPMLRAPKIDSEMLSTPNIYNDEKVLLFFHGPSLIWAHRDPITGRIRPDESVVANPVIHYIQWARKRGYGVVDVFLSPLETTTPAKLVSYICDNTIRYFKAKQIVILGAGQAYSYAVQTAAHRELKECLSAIVCFVGPEDTLRQFPSSSDDAAVKRFHDRSLIFISQNHPTWKQKYARKKCGRLIKADGRNLYAVMREKFDETIEYIDAEDDDEEDDSEEDDSNNENGSDDD